MPWIVRLPNGTSAFLDCFSELVVRVGMLGAPSPQKRNQVPGALPIGWNWHDSSERLAGFEQKRRLTLGMNSFHQLRQATSSIFNRVHGFVHSRIFYRAFRGRSSDDMTQVGIAQSGSALSIEQPGSRVTPAIQCIENIQYPVFFMLVIARTRSQVQHERFE